MKLNGINKNQWIMLSKKVAIGFIRIFKNIDFIGERAFQCEYYYETII